METVALSLKLNILASRLVPKAKEPGLLQVAFRALFSK